MLDENYHRQDLDEREQRTYKCHLSIAVNTCKCLWIWFSTIAFRDICLTEIGPEIHHAEHGGHIRPVLLVLASGTG